MGNQQLERRISWKCCLMMEQRPRNNLVAVWK
jgi:hypothetical protein